jgi:hypothetical protein
LKDWRRFIRCGPEVIRVRRNRSKQTLEPADYFRGHNDLAVGTWTPAGHRQIRIAFHDGVYTVAVTGGAEPLVLGSHATLEEAEAHVRQAAASLA